MKGTGRFSARVRVGQASRRRISAGGPLAFGRPAAGREAWREVRAQILARAHWRCQACDLPTHRLEVHHIRKRGKHRRHWCVHDIPLGCFAESQAEPRTVS